MTEQTFQTHSKSPDEKQRHQGHEGYKAYGLTMTKLVACLAYIRRKFVDVKKIQAKKRSGKVDVVLNLIGKLYGIKQRIKENPIADKFNIRQSHAKPIVKELHHWLINHKDKISPKSKLGEAISYSLNQFDKFQRYLDDGRLSIDINRAERAIKPFVIGRKAWLFSNTSKWCSCESGTFSFFDIS